MLKQPFRLSAVIIAASVSLTLLELGLSAQQPSPTQSPAAPQSQSTPQTPASQPHSLSRSTMRMALPRREYLCAGGARIIILLETKAARLTLNGHIYNMKQVETDSGSASDSKYAAGMVVWSST